ncbi:glycosyltransferase [Microcoleus sp. FACHB-53]|nr:glycosyltransferase [Microcoleus sp. FACHB-53]
MKPLNLFYEIPDGDRWLPLDRYPRRLIRRLMRGKPNPGGQTRVFLNLCAGLDRLGISYRVNDYRYIQKHPEEVACIIGKPHVLDKIKWKNPIVFGAAVFSHPCDDPELLNRLPISRVLVPGEWHRKMFEPYYSDKVLAWPVGIDTDKWVPVPIDEKDIDILLYDKVRWEYDRYETELISPIKSCLEKWGLKVEVIRYGFYREEEFHSLLGRSKAMVFLCEHETQGIAYQQALACGVPILAWDRGGFWQDPSYFPDKIKFTSVSSVPYWDNRCGVKFNNISEFPPKAEEFLDKLNSHKFTPRDYILENLTLEKCAQRYLKILGEVQNCD